MAIFGTMGSTNIFCLYGSVNRQWNSHGSVVVVVEDDDELDVVERVEAVVDEDELVDDDELVEVVDEVVATYPGFSAVPPLFATENQS